MQSKDQLRKQVIQYFRSVGSGQNIVQCIKEALFLHEKFSPVSLFDALAKGKQKLLPVDIRSYLLDHNIIFNEQELRYYLNLNEYGSEITLNEFLEAMIPFNSDVVREFRQRYLQALDIRQVSSEVDFIFAQLMDNHFKFIRSLINLRKEITAMATRKQIEALIKEDLVLRSKPREARKFHEAFQSRGFVLGFHQLRKFLELWLSAKEIIHEFYLLNVMRHLKSDRPFDNIIMKGNGKFRQFSAKKRAQSATDNPSRDFNQNTSEKVRERLVQEANQQQNQAGFFSNTKEEKEDKYSAYRNEVIDAFNKERLENKQSNRKMHAQRHQANSTSKKENRQEQKNEALQRLRRSKYERNAKGGDGTLIVEMLTEIVMKEERLEKLRKNLAKSTDFNLINLFKIVDARNKGFIAPGDLLDFTEQTKTHFDSLVSFYAREVGRLRFHEFCLIFRPLSKQLNEQIDNRQQHKVPNPFKKETYKLIVEVLIVTADMQNTLSQIRQRIKTQRVSVANLFLFMDLEGKGYIDGEGLQRVLSENNVSCDDKNLKCLMKLFKKKVTERISPQQFISFIDS